MRKTTLFNGLASILFAGLTIYFGVYLFHVDQKVDHIYRPARLFNPCHIESPELSKFDFPDTMTHDLNKFCYIFCQQLLLWHHKGEHCYVFVTKDDRHVVKFLPIQLSKRHLNHAILSAQLGFDELQKETGLEFLHLNRTTRTARGMALDDFYGVHHRICGDNARFIVQKKASLLYPTLSALIREGKVEEAKKRIDQVIELFYSLAKKKISEGDDDSCLNDSVGFTKDRAIFVDTWNFSKIPFIDVSARMRYEFRMRLDSLKKWLDIMSPELASYYRAQREAIEKAS
jgi:hypothetical protein